MNRIAEEVFMSHAMETLKMPSQEEACQFSTEAIYNRMSIGLHASKSQSVVPTDLCACISQMCWNDAGVSYECNVAVPALVHVI